MNNLHDRFRSLDDLSTPDLWREVEARAQAMPRSGFRMLPWALVAVMLLVLALAIGGAALIGSGVVKLPSAPSLLRSPSPTPSPTASPITGPIVGTWAGGETTCAQQLAAIEAAGFSVAQMTSVGVDRTCENGIAVEGAGWAIGSQNTARFFPNGILDVSDDVYPLSIFTYRLIGDTAFEATDALGICVTFGYAIEGDQLSIEIIDNGCLATGKAPLADQIGLTVLFETSPFTRQP
jgi:hypothetical protein